DPDSLKITVKAQRPILISSGYLSCYWCFRMGKDTFHDPAVAAYINQHYYPILIDSEIMGTEDGYLQEFMGETQQFSGWPANVLLTPDGYPVFGFSYVDPGTLLRLL
ncbi:MAG: DUF255 domain-containing protein, partial [Nitrospinaceae bacterium]|nr:DUF255 domain-containing protein [Nitrospinaceae bacterium]